MTYKEEKMISKLSKVNGQYRKTSDIPTSLKVPYLPASSKGIYLFHIAKIDTQQKLHIPAITIIK